MMHLLLKCASRAEVRSSAELIMSPEIGLYAIYFYEVSVSTIKYTYKCMRESSSLFHCTQKQARQGGRSSTTRANFHTISGNLIRRFIVCPLSKNVCPLSQFVCPLSQVVCPLSINVCLLSQNESTP